MDIKIPPGMPPYWNTQITCRHCGVFIKTFTPKHPDAWERELEAIKDKVSERCYCRKTADELRDLLRQPENILTEHRLYRVWLNWALNYRFKECGEGRKHAEGWYQAEHVPGLVIKLPPKERKNKAAARSEWRR